MRSLDTQSSGSGDVLPHSDRGNAMRGPGANSTVAKEDHDQSELVQTGQLKVNVRFWTFYFFICWSNVCMRKVFFFLIWIWICLIHVCISVDKCVLFAKVMALKLQSPHGYCPPMIGSLV